MMTNDNGVTLPTETPALRADALRSAREVLLVKSGKFAERDLDPFAVLVVSEYILTGDVNAALDHLMMREDADRDRWGATTPDPLTVVVTVPEAATPDQVQQVIEKIDDVLADVIPFDDGNGAGLNR